MTDKKDGQGPKDGPGKAAERGGSDVGGKRPFATIDLKAVEVPAAETARSGPTAPKAAQPQPKAPPAATPRSEADAARKVAAAAAAIKAGSGPGAGAASGAGPGKPATASAATGATGSVPPAGGATAAASSVRPTSATSAPGAVPQPPPPPRRSGGGSHLLAGLAGGALALLASPFVTPVIGPMLDDLGIHPPSPQPSAEVAQRLLSLERKVATPQAPDPARDPARAIAETEANRQRIEELARTLAALNEAHARTMRMAAQNDARLAKEPPIADVGERIVKLEQQLGQIAAAAQSEPDRAGRIPQLAQLTGRLTDIEGSLATRIDEARKDLAREVDAKIAPAAEASETARATAQRLDREIGSLRGETNRLATGLDQVKTSTERLQLALKSAQDQTAEVASALDAARRELDTRIKATARPADVSAAVAPIANQLNALERGLTTVVKSETERNATAERIVLSLELGNLKRAMERGAPYGRELEAVRKLAGPRVDVAALERWREEGVPTVSELSRAFRPVANAMLDADAERTDGTVVDRLLSGARTFVRVRKTTHAPGDKSPEAVVARIEDALKAGRLGDVIAEANALERKPAVAKDWIAKVEARQSVDNAIRALDEALKASLGASPAAPAPAAPAPAAPAQKKGQP
ncbi:MAG: hypothetical protein AB7F78_17730 [Hyphomicrobiaceae bacterium]